MWFAASAFRVSGVDIPKTEPSKVFPKYASSFGVNFDPNKSMCRLLEKFDKFKNMDFLEKVRGEDSQPITGWYTFLSK